MRKESFTDRLRLHRAELFSERLLTANVKSLKIQRGRLTKKMQNALNEFVQQHPEYLQNSLQACVREFQHRIIFTPPHTPALSPIEPLWAEVKRHVVNRFEYGCIITHTKPQMLDAFYDIEGDDVDPDIFVMGDEDDISLAREKKEISKVLVYLTLSSQKSLARNSSRAMIGSLENFII